MKFSLSLVLIFILILFHPQQIISATNDISMTIVVSGETHGMIFPCDCPKEPGGGMAKRATLVNGLGDRNSVLLLDVGAFAGGGIYDPYTEGRKGDSIRTVSALKAMGAMKYDGVAIGDDDLQYGGKWLLDQAKTYNVPLISANAYIDSKPMGSQFLIIRKGQLRIGITSITTTEKLFSLDSSIQINDPIKSLRSIWKDFVNQTDYRIILAHAGQELSAAIVDSFPDCNLVVNGHRKSTTQPVVMIKNTPVMQFGYLGKTLSYASLRLTHQKMSMIKSGWFYATPDIREDDAIVKLISSDQVAAPENVYDLYMMSECPYGLEALKQMSAFFTKLPVINLNIWFIGNVGKDNSFNSLHGEEEVNDELIWLAIKSIYPKKWKKFLSLRSESMSNTESLFKELGIDKNELNKWIAKSGKSELAFHYARSTRLGINSSPTLLINNQPYDKQVSADRLLKNECNLHHTKSCDSLPECFDDTDCKQTGKIGRCLQPGKCEYREAVKFSFQVIIADSSIQHPEDAVIATTQDLFAGAAIEKIKASSPKGAELLRKFGPQSLPFYIFGSEVKQAFNFDNVESGLIEAKEALFFKDKITRSNYFYKRESKKNQLVLFLDPLLSPGNLIIEKLINSQKHAITIKPILVEDPSKAASNNEEQMRREEALRWLIIEQSYGKSFKEYVHSYLQTPGTSYWFKIIDKLNVPLADLCKKVENDSSSLSQHWNMQTELGIHDPAVLLINNRETVVLKTEQDLEKVVKMIQ